MDNPLVDAVYAHDRLLNLQGDAMFEVAGEAAFEPWDDILSAAVADLVCQASAAVAGLSPRARQARLNLIWRDFVAEQRQRR
jgi:hypothetical protein